MIKLERSMTIKANSKMVPAFLGLITLILLVCATGCGGKVTAVIGQPSESAVEVTPSAAQLGESKFENRLIKVKMGFKTQADAPNPLVRKYIFRGEQREFAVIVKRGTYEDVFAKLKPGDLCEIYGVFRVPDTDKYPRIEVE
jgi:hypothetical protein